MGSSKPPFPCLGLSFFEPFDSTQFVFDSIDKAVLVPAQLRERPCVVVAVVISAVVVVGAGHYSQTMRVVGPHLVISLGSKAAVTQLSTPIPFVSA